MARTPGATNRTPREMRKDGEHQIKMAKLKAENQALKKKLADEKKQKRAK